jgi:hypothetical protein
MAGLFSPAIVLYRSLHRRTAGVLKSARVNDKVSAGQNSFIH